MSSFRVLEPQVAPRSPDVVGRRDLTQVDYHELMALGRAERARVAADLVGRALRWLGGLVARR